MWRHDDRRAESQSAGAWPSEIGTVLAQRYEVVRELGRGGMGVVYLCRDVVTGDRVALKRLRSPEKGETPRRGELVVSPGGARRRARSTTPPSCGRATSGSWPTAARSS